MPSPTATPWTRLRLGALALLALVGLGLGLARAASPRGVTVLAAASLTDVLPRVAAAWKGAGGGDVSFSFDASSRLARQIEAGVPADLFFSADSRWMDEVEGKGLLAPGTRLDLLGNSLVVVVPSHAASVPKDALALTDPGIAHLALAGEQVPAGRYARAALRALTVWEALSARVVTGDSVRTALAWVGRGEAEAAVVYATDARVEPRVRVAFTFPASSHPPIVYPAARLAGGPNAGGAQAFLTFCQGPEARTIFADAGFPPAAAP